jgi:hypothetical protein
MRRLTSLIPVLLAAALGACRSHEPKTSSNGEAQMVSIVVRSEPPGARVRVNRLIKTWITPCDIADFAITKGMIDLEISLEGYDSVTPRVFYDGEHPVKVEAMLVSNRPPAPPPEPPKPATPAPAAAPETQAGIQIRVEPVQGGSRVTVAPARSRVRVTSSTILTDGDRGGVYFLANVPPEKAVVEVLDPVTDAVLQVLTIPGIAAPAAVAPAAPAPQFAPAPFYAAPSAPAVPAVQYIPVQAAPYSQTPMFYPQPAHPYSAVPAPTYYYFAPAGGYSAPSLTYYPYYQPR